MTTSRFEDLIHLVAERGRQLLKDATEPVGSRDLSGDCARLLSSHGEASGVAIARRILTSYLRSTEEGKDAFFRLLVDRFSVDRDALQRAYEAYMAEPTPAHFTPLFEACEPPRQELFRRLNLAPGGTAALVAMREDLQSRLREDPELEAVDYDMAHLLASWFNRGFLVLRHIDWGTPALVLEKIIRYEAVHEISDWDELRRRVEPQDRRCFGFFHPALPDEPLVFVEVALTDEVAASIQQLLDRERQLPHGAKPSTAVFYSISNCQKALRGVSFGNFLIKQVVENLSREIPSLKTYVTLSPVPGFMKWLTAASADPARPLGAEADRQMIEILQTASWHRDPAVTEQIEKRLMALAAHYFVSAKGSDGYPVDPVARFHLGNGARLDRINWLGDVSPKGMRESAGLMVNFRYDPAEIEDNHERYANSGVVAASRSVQRLARAYQKQAEDHS